MKVPQSVIAVSANAIFVNIIEKIKTAIINTRNTVFPIPISTIGNNVFKMILK